MGDLVAHSSATAIIGLVIALASLLLNVFIVPGGIYLMRAFVREEIKLHDGTEHAHPNLKTQSELVGKLDALTKTVGEAFDHLKNSMAALRLEISESRAADAKERREDIESAIRAHEERENDNQRRILDEAKALAQIERRKRG